VGTAKRERQKRGRQDRLAIAERQRQRRQRIKTIRNFAIVVLLIVIALFVLSRRDAGNSSNRAGFPYGTGACPNPDGSSPRTIDFSAAPKQCIDPSKTYTATFDTTAGTVVVKLDAKSTPGTVNNFVVLARYHYYDGTQLFRASSSLGILQGGSPHDNSTGDKGPGYDLPDEGFDYASLTQGASGATGGPYKYVAGDLVMARAARANGASAQFFFGVNDNVSQLDSQGVYVRFGSTTEGLDVLQRILASAPQDNGPPNPPVTINSVTITES